MASSQDWFDGRRPTDEGERTFLEALRTAARAWSFADLRPEDTSAGGEESGCLVEIRVPLLTTSCRILRVCYAVDEEDSLSLQSEWTGFDEPFEGLGYESPDPETDLWVTGVEASPEQCALWSAAWFERQLRRPVKRREWDRPESGWSTLIPGSTTRPAYVESTAYQPERALDRQGGLRWWWLEHQPPSREIWERSPGTPVENGRE